MPTPSADTKVQSETQDLIAKQAAKALYNIVCFECSEPFCKHWEAQAAADIAFLLRNERERCARAICLFCAEPEHYGPPKEIEGSKRLWHADLRNDCNGVVQCQAAAIREGR